MRRSGMIMCLALLGCSQQPTFDERYEEAEKAIRDKAAAIDEEIAGRETSRATDAAASNGVESTERHGIAGQPR